MSKGKATRSSTATSSTPAPPPIITNDILAGRYTEGDWHSMLEAEDGEELVFDLVEVIVGGVMEVIHQKHIDRNLVPFSLNWAKDMMVQLVEWQFMNHDEGEKEASGNDSWLEDEEPYRAAVDSWARGAVPCRIIEEEREKSVETDLTISDVESVEEEKEETSEEKLSNEDFRHREELVELNKLRAELQNYKISDDDIKTLVKIAKPAEPLVFLYQALHLLKEGDSHAFAYTNSVAQLKDKQTQQFIADFVPGTVELETMKGLTGFIGDIQLHPDHIEKQCKAALGLCNWLHLVYSYQQLCYLLNVQTSIDYNLLVKNHIVLKSMSKPPQLVKEVLGCLFMLLGVNHNEDWKVMKKQLGRADFITQLQTFDNKKLSLKLKDKVKKRYFSNPEFNIDHAKSVSEASVDFFRWCEDQVFGSGSNILPPSAPKPKAKSRRIVKIVKHADTPSVREEPLDTGGSVNNMLPHQSAAIVKAQQGRPPGQKEVEYDSQGNVTSVVKVDPRRLPTHRIKAKFEIVEPSVNNKMNTYTKLLKPIKKKPTRPSSGKASTSFLLNDLSSDHTPLPPSFVDAIQASPGVVIKQGSKIKRGPDSNYLPGALSPLQQSSLFQASQLLYSNK